jgi:hypothetical protein
MTNNFLVRQIKRVLQVQQPGDQARRSRRTATTRHEALTHQFAQPFPVNQLGQTHQWVSQVDVFTKRISEKVFLAHKRFGGALKPRQNLQDPKG